MDDAGRCRGRVRGARAALAVSIVALSLCVWSVPRSDGESVPIPQLGVWEKQMLIYGEKHGAAMVAAKFAVR